jgi:hypothetical protein
MALYKREKFEMLKVSPDDGIDAWLVNKLVEGSNLKISQRDDLSYGKQLVFSVPGAGEAKGKMLELNQSAVIPSDVSLVVIYANTDEFGAVQVTLPHPSEFSSSHLAVVCAANEKGIGLAVPEGAKILDDSNIDLNYAGDSLLFMSNLKDTWYCVSRYSANWYA